MLNSDLKQSKQWVLWKKDPKRGKVPYQFNGLPAATNDKETWETYDTCKGALAQTKRFDGIGIVLDSQNAFITVIDLDHCIDNGVVKPYAQTIIDRFNSYTEYSQSGAGIHIFILATKQTKRCRITVEGQELEIYDSGRFIAVTENMLLDLPIENRQDELNTLCSEIFPQEKEREFRPVVKVDMSDHDLFEVMMKDKKFAELWTVPNSEHHSEQDQALCNKLAFYCGRDEQRIDYWFRQSPLMRDKWERKDYRQRTIQKAVMDCSEVYTPPTVFTAELLKDDLATVYDTLGQKEIDRLSKLSEKFLAEKTLLNDNFLAKVFHELNKDSLIYSQREQDWFYWTEINWEKAPETDIIERAKKVQDFLFNLCEKVQDSKVKGRLIKFTTNAGNLTKLKAIVDLSKTLLKYDGDFDSNPTRINCLNGIIDLRTCKLLPHNKDEYWHKTIQLEFHPEYGREEAPYFYQFLDTIFATTNNPIQWIKWLQTVSGYCLTGLTREQQAYFIYGSSGTGKSTFANLLTTIMGPYATITPNDFFMQKTGKSDFDPDSLRGKRLVLSSESTDSKSFDEERFKTWQGETDVFCNRKYKSPITFRPICKFIFTLNELPQFNISEAMLRRMNVCLMDNTTIVKDKYLREKLESELVAIFAWVVQGAFYYFDEGIITPEGQEDILKDYITNNNHFARFINENYNIHINEHGEIDDTKFVKCKDLYDHYVRWCHEQGENPRSQAKAIRQMKEITGLSKMSKKVKFLNGKTTNVVYGLTMKESVYFSEDV